MQSGANPSLRLIPENGKNTGNFLDFGLLGCSGNASITLYSGHLLDRCSLIRPGKNRELKIGYQGIAFLNTSFESRNTLQENPVSAGRETTE
jgi:hypothetical protein